MCVHLCLDLNRAFLGEKLPNLLQKYRQQFLKYDCESFSEGSIIFIKFCKQNVVLVLF